MKVAPPKNTDRLLRKYQGLNDFLWWYKRAKWDVEHFGIDYAAGHANGWRTHGRLK